MEQHGEDEFNWVTFYSCVTFLMDLNSQRLNMSTDEFERRMSATGDFEISAEERCIASDAAAAG